MNIPITKKVKDATCNTKFPASLEVAKNADGSGGPISIAKKTKNDPCWKNYEMVGMKTKGGKKVPNCVPKK